MENQTTSSSIWQIAIVALIVALAGLLIYKDMSREANAPSVDGNTSLVATNTTQTISSDKPGVIQGDGYTIEQIPVPKITMLRPNTERSMTFPTGTPTEVQNAINQKIALVKANLKKNPDSFQDWLDIGIYWKSGGDYEGARLAWEYAAAIAPSSHIPHANLGDLYANYLKDYPKAEAELKKASTLKADYIPAYLSLYNLYKLSYIEKSSLALPTLFDGLKKNPASIDLMVALGAHYKSLGDKSNALKYYNMALAQAKKAGDTQHTKSIEAELKAIQ